MGKFLTLDERNELLKELSLERSKKYADRIRVILLLDDGETYANIAKFLFLDQGSIANFRKRYKEGGIEGLINDHYFGRIAFLSFKNQQILIDDLRFRIFASTSEVIVHVKAKFGITYSRGGMTELLHRLGFSFKKATAVPGKASKNEQIKFVKKYNNLPSEVPLYFADSTHPEFGPTITYGWIKKGETFEVKTNSGWRKRVNICGAVEINSLQVIARTFDTINKYSICELMRAISQKSKQKKSYLVLDGAAYNKATIVKNLAKKLKIKILYLPAYSPNLNPIERLWKFMKKKVTANKYYEEFDDFKKSLVNFFKGIRKYKNELRTLITDNFPILGT
jgi:transposase